MKKTAVILILLLALLLPGCMVETAPAQTVPEGEGLLVHFIDVGQADCTLLQYGEFSMLIDGGNVDDGQLVVSYLEDLGIDSLTAVVCTHAHEDHVGGLPSVMAVYPVQDVFSPTRTYSSRCFDDFMYYAGQQGLEVTIPQPGDGLVVDEVLDITFLGPVESYPDTNNTSLVVKVEYGDTSFLFTGDMETDAENDMLDYWGSRVDWNVDVLKVGHHGSNTSTGYRFLYEVSPDYGVIPVGADNSYGHPHDEPLSRLKDAGVTVLRTDELGTILACSDGQEITFTWDNQSAQPEDVEPGEDMVYIGNKNSQKVHSPDCDSLPAQKNRVEFDSLKEALEAGYTPCGSCLG